MSTMSIELFPEIQPRGADVIIPPTLQHATALCPIDASKTLLYSPLTLDTQRNTAQWRPPCPT